MTPSVASTSSATPSSTDPIGSHASGITEPHDAPGASPVLVGDHPALDLINTIAPIDGQMVDFLQSDDDVLRWLIQTGYAAPDESFPFKPDALRDAAHSLRDTLRTLIDARKAAAAPSPSLDVRALNAFLSRGHYQIQLTPKPDGLQIAHRYERRSAEQVLMPIAAAAADLIVNGNFDLVRKCEDRECTLCFYDRTKSHRRRWCSMATCGNRNKVANFRRRQSERRADHPTSPDDRQETERKT
ncbi:ABATE domain-containing protein [Paraburkholderia sp.]|uniref:CGNR zinc finger domain-containing protein n=1 Tax=Paraburkholderia sp. TaxID=1926495 RepID=UPI00239CFE47|nr:ABATE domain-containing protein [Paraburkholderia sp.]MDE1180183.1 ABATE domain-containing protein [Paraburkholderia sp.]